MQKYAKVIDNETKLCEIAVGTNIDYYEANGMTELEVEQAYNNQWYLAGYAPQPTEKERLKKQIEDLEAQYGMSRWQRELILAENSQASAYVKNKAQEIETLAEQLRNLEQEQ